MSQLFDRELFLKNISFCLKKAGISELRFEEMAEITSGYISRLRASNSMPSIEKVCSIANALNVDIQDIVGIDLSAVSPLEQKQIKFLRKVKTQYRANLIQIKQCLPADIADILGTSGKEQLSVECDSSTGIVSYSSPVVNEVFRLTGIAFSITLNSRDDVIILGANANLALNGVGIVEAYLLSGNSVVPFSSSFGGVSVVGEEARSLYDELANSNVFNKSGYQISKILDAYLAEDKVTHEAGFTKLKGGVH